MRIALVSAPVVTGDVEVNLSSIISAVETCSGKAELVLLGESVLQGFDCLCWEYHKDIFTAVDLNDPSIKAIQTAAMKNRVAVCFGYIERRNEFIFSSSLFVGDDGEVVHNFHRVSVGWKELCADCHYAEGECFETFSYKGKQFAIGLCGDLWTEGRPEEMKNLDADVVLWPVWCDYNADEWNSQIKYEYAEQACKCGKNVLYVNPYCIDECEDSCAAGGAVHFCDGRILCEHPAGSKGVLIVEV